MTDRRSFLGALLGAAMSVPAMLCRAPAPPVVDGPTLEDLSATVGDCLLQILVACGCHRTLVSEHWMVRGELLEIPAPPCVGWCKCCGREGRLVIELWELTRTLLYIESRDPGDFRPIVVKAPHEHQWVGIVELGPKPPPLRYKGLPVPYVPRLARACYVRP